MDPTQLYNLQFYMLIGIFLIGFITFLSGVIILLTGAWGKELRSTLEQTNRLAQKGLADEVSGLVGNAASLLASLNDLIKTRNGIGITLILIGGILMLIPCWFVLFKLK
jgi:hypothetical protein